MAKLIAGISSDRARGPQVTRQGEREMRVWIRPLTSSGHSIEVEAYMWNDGTVSLAVTRDHKVLHEWRSDT